MLTFKYFIMKQKNDSISPKGRLVKVDGVQFQLIDGKLYRYADLTMDKGFKIVFGQIGSEELLKNLLNRLLSLRQVFIALIESLVS